jgi:putative membrane protein
VTISALTLQRALLIAFAAVWVALAIAPLYPQDWWLENVVLLVAAPLIVWRHRRQPFSNAACACLFAFGVLHVIGAHYTYSEVPYDRWIAALAGEGPGTQLHAARNHYDRFVHLAYGLLLARPAIELLDSATTPRGLWRWLLPALFLMSHSVIYELIEWLAALRFGGDLGQAYLGTQGDEWDSQKDMALAALGAALAVTFVRMRQWRSSRRPPARA